MATERKAIHAYLEVGSHETIHEFAGDNGISVSGLLEALAGQLVAGEDGVDLPPEQRLISTDSMIRAARKIDARRRRRS